MASSSPSPPNGGQLVQRSDSESQLSSVVYDLFQQVQAAMENMLKMINEIDQSSAEIKDEIEKCKYSALERQKTLEEQKDCVQKAAYAVLEMLHNREIK